MFREEEFINLMKENGYKDSFLKQVYEKCTKNIVVVVSGERGSGKRTLIFYLNHYFPNVSFVENYGENNIICEDCR